MTLNPLPINSKPMPRRNLLQAGALGILGMSMVDVARWRAEGAETGVALPKAKAVIYVFLTGGPSQHDTFDMKPDGPVEYKGEFQPIATQTAGVQICEHLPKLAQRSKQWSLVRSLTHTESDHERGTYVMLTGRSVVPTSFRRNTPQSSDLPSIAAIAGYATERRETCPKVRFCRRRFITPTAASMRGNSPACSGCRIIRG